MNFHYSPEGKKRCARSRTNGAQISRREILARQRVAGGKGYDIASDDRLDGLEKKTCSPLVAICVVIDSAAKRGTAGGENSDAGVSCGRAGMKRGIVTSRIRKWLSARVKSHPRTRKSQGAMSSEDLEYLEIDD